MVTLIVIGDILVTGSMVALIAWLFARSSDEKIDEAARIPFLEDE